MTEVAIASLTKTFGAGKTKAVDNLSLTMGDGEFISLLGPSGCGKTTTLNIIAGFETADRGSICFDGQDVANLPAEKRDIGMVFQSYALFPHMTVAGNLGFGLEMRKIAKAEMKTRIARVLDMVQLSGFEDRHPRQLSGGQQQRVALARALVIEPRILLLDEPLANLDAKLREEMRVFIRDLQKRVGITTVYVTHDQAEAMTMSDRVVVMFNGRIAQIGTPTEIYERPVSIEVARFVGQINLIDGVVSTGGGGRHEIDTPLGRIAMAGASSRPIGARVTLGLRPESIVFVSPGSRNGWNGMVSARYYTGNLVDYRVALDAGVALHVQALPSIRHTAGETVVLGAPDESFVLLEAGDAP